MNRVNAIINNPKFKKYIAKNEEHEVNREFCHHDMQHFLDVARLAYIMVLERKLTINKEIIYGAAMLHDIGRWMQYEEDISHDLASYKLSKEILIESGYNNDEIEVILSAILKHRKKDDNENSFNYIFYISDKLSRKCFLCKAANKCNWSEGKKNYKIIY
ncbi:HD domain-containing protein [Clostridium sp. DJ247]|uniref:HD domain-containing protein n=1 Tax=Clostridium sp. DJ247 TaxID=2726188 RepID=UPI001624761C|nr:HD domain-containing protein [Clostridium sp. DJ247]MBC2582934.1 HD domain-containing protein [Clostridium sp. DJ247]